MLLTAAKSLYERARTCGGARYRPPPAGRVASRPAIRSRTPATGRRYGRARNGHRHPPSLPTPRHWGVELRSPALTGRVFAFQRSTDFPRYLDDHRLYGSTVVTPASSHLATILSALASEGRPLAIEDFVCSRALVIKDGEHYEAQIVVGDEDETPKLTVLSLVDPVRSHWEEHLSGRLSVPSPAPHPTPDPAAFVASAERHFTGEECYAYLRALGYTLGPSFCWIADVWIRGDESLVRYAQPTLPDDPAAYEIYPGLIDSCFQSIVGFMVDDEAGESPSLAIPFAAAKLSFPGRPEAGVELYGHVRVLKTQVLDNGRRQIELADLHMFTGNGASVLIAERFRVRQASRAVLENSLRGASPMAYELGWVPQPERAMRHTGSRTAVVIGGSEQLTARLCAALRAQGHHARAESGETPIDGGVDLVVDARFCEPGAATTAADALMAATRVTTTLQNTPRHVPYAVLGDGSTAASPIRETLWGLLAALEAEASDRRLIRTTLNDGWTPEGLVRALSQSLDSDIPETRLALDGNGIQVARLTRVTVAPVTPVWNGSVLVTGGLGALGLSVATALARQGTKEITLMGRSTPDPAAQRVIDVLVTRGVRVTVVAGDVTDPAACARAVACASEYAPLCGVFHLAGVTDDHAFERLTPEDFARVFAAKARGAQTLAQATRGHQLAAFVLFSSASAVLGSAGQVNYAAANGYLNGLAQTLRAEGVPATSVNWGPWVPEVKGGMAAAVLAPKATQVGIRPITDDEAAPLLDLAVGTSRSMLVMLAADFDRYTGQLAGSPRGMVVSELRTDRRRETAERSEADRGKGWLRQAVESLEPPAREDALRAAIHELAGEVLGEDEVDDAFDFEDMGLDSIMLIDLRTQLAHALDADLPNTVAIDHPNIPAIARFITESGLVGSVGYLGALRRGLTAHPVSSSPCR